MLWHGLARSVILLLGCARPTESPPVHTEVPEDTAEAESAPTGRTLRVRVTLDGKPVAGTLVMQGGASATWTTDAAGEVTVAVDYGVDGDIVVLSAHPDARVDGYEVDDETVEPLEIALVRFDPADNVAYPFQDPGEGAQADSSSEQCLHCHSVLHEGWFASPHRTAASNPALHDLYQGIALALDAEGCAARGGAWVSAVEPGTGKAMEVCRVGAGVLPDAGGGTCADCHAPGIDGELGGRDLLEARDHAYAYGVHCDVCHKVAAVDLEAEPGVGGRLRIVRPSEPSPSPMLGTYAPLTFGPHADVLNPRMGQVYREELFHGAELCAGCHEQHQPALLGAVDLARWPDGLLPVHTTWSEWDAGPMNPAAPCQSCHMPADPTAGNGADLYQTGSEPALIGIASGWIRPPGSVHLHTFAGPRGVGADGGPSPMLQLAATVDVASTLDGDVLGVEATVRNVGPGHALPTGEPMRSLVLLVEAACDGEPLLATGGDVVPDYGGYRAGKDGSEDWSRWEGALPGDHLRVVRWGGWRDYTGHGPFGDGTFGPEEKGIRVEEWVGAVEVLAVEGDAVTTDAPLPAGDYAWLVRDEDYAGSPGFGFARVMVDAAGARMVPHFAAVDVVSDNRLLPQAAWTSAHQFSSPCPDPSVTARLYHRNYPSWLAEERGWELVETLMAEVTR
jgi:hypothetical protein